MNHLKETILLVSLFLMNAAGFLVMFIDKQSPPGAAGGFRSGRCCSLAALGGSGGAFWECISSITRPNI